MTRLMLCLLLVLVSRAQAEPVAFAIFGDTPYSPYERRLLPRMMEQMAETLPAFVIHVGDIKSGQSPCSDESYRDILELFQSSRPPLIYVPGDNEWTDCNRRRENSHDPLERLQTLREMFFPDDYALGQNRLKLERQSRKPRFGKYVENVRWEMAGALFVGMNIPGSDNNIVDFEHPSQEFIERGEANAQWLHESFILARKRRLAGILIAIQADPDFDADAKGKANGGYRAFIDQLRKETQDFSGQVVLAHGDTHHERIDQPLADPRTGQPLANFTRVETYGSPFMGWIQGSVDRDDPKVFRFVPRPFSTFGDAE